MNYHGSFEHSRSFAHDLCMHASMHMQIIAAISNHHENEVGAQVPLQNNRKVNHLREPGSLPLAARATDWEA